MSAGRGRIVHSSRTGRLCEHCGWPAKECHCSARLASGEEAVPERPTAKLRVESRGSGRSVTVVDGLPKNTAFLEQTVRELKRLCGTGGAAGGGRVELQGDQRERLRDLLQRKGWRVKG